MRSRKNSIINDNLTRSSRSNSIIDEKAIPSSVNSILENESETKSIDIQINDPTIPLNLNLLGTILSSLIHGIPNRPIILPNFRIEEMIVIVYQQHFNLPPKRQFNSNSNRNNNLPSIRSRTTIPLDQNNEKEYAKNDKSKSLPFINLSSNLLPNEYHLIDSLLSYYILCLYFSVNTSYPNKIIHQVISLLQFIHTESLIVSLQAESGPATPHMKIGKLKQVFTRNLELDVSFKLEIFNEGLQYATWISRQTMRLARILEKIKINNGIGPMRNQRSSSTNQSNTTNTIPTNIEEVACLHPICIYFMSSFAISHISLMLFHHHLLPLSPGLVESILVGMLNMSSDRRINAVKEEEKLEHTHPPVNSTPNISEDIKYYDDISVSTNRSRSNTMNSSRINSRRSSVNNTNLNPNMILSSTKEDDESRMSTSIDNVSNDEFSTTENNTARTITSDSKVSTSREYKEFEKEKEKQLNPSTIVYNRLNSMIHYTQRLFTFIGHIILDNRIIESVLYTRSKFQKNLNNQLFQFVQHRVSLIREEIEALTIKSTNIFDKKSFSNKQKMTLESKDFHFFRESNLYLDVFNPPENMNQLLPSLGISRSMSLSSPMMPIQGIELLKKKNTKSIYEKQYNHYWSLRKSYRHIFLLFSSSYQSLSSGETFAEFFNDDYYSKSFLNNGNRTISIGLSNSNPESVLLETNVNKEFPVDEFDSSFQIHDQDYLRSKPFSLNIISSAIKKIEKRTYYCASNYILARTLNPLEEIYWILTYILEFLHKKSQLGEGYWPNLSQEKYAISKQLKKLNINNDENENYKLTRKKSPPIVIVSKKGPKVSSTGLNLELLLSNAKKEANMENRLLKIQDQLNKPNSIQTNESSSLSIVSIDTAKQKAFEEQQKVLLEAIDQSDTYKFIQNRFTSRPGSRGLLKSPLVSQSGSRPSSSIFRGTSFNHSQPAPPPPLPSVVWYCPPKVLIEKEVTIFTTQDNNTDFEDPLQNLPSQKDNIEYLEKINNEKKLIEEEEKAFNQFLEDQQDLLISLNRQHRTLTMRKMRIQKQNELQEKSIRHAQIEEYLKQVQFNEKQELRLKTLKDAEIHEQEIERITLLRQKYEYEEEAQKIKYEQLIQFNSDAITNIKSGEEAREIKRQQEEEARMKFLEERQRRKEEEREILLKIKQDQKIQVQLKNKEEIEKVRNRLRKGNFLSSSTPTLSIPNSNFLPTSLTLKKGKSNNLTNIQKISVPLSFGKDGLKFYDNVKDESSFEHNYYIQYEDPSSGKPYYFDPSTNLTTFSKPYDLKIRHYIDVEREAYDAEYGEGAYDAYKADIVFKDSVNLNGGYFDEKGVWVWVNGYYDEDYNWVENEGYYDENGRFIRYAKVTGDLSFMV